MTDLTVDTLVLREFRLAAVDADGAVARIVAATPAGREPAVPLLTSIDDRRDVATIERTRDGSASGTDEARHALLAPFVATWRPAKEYVPRIAERSAGSATHYRLAVTESGINDEKRETPGVSTTGSPHAHGTPLDLLWIGKPRGSYAGLLVLLGNHEDPPTPRAERPDWPLLASRRLGVRIYDSGG